MKIETFKGKNNQYYFRIVAKNGKTIAQSEGYKQKASRTKTINALLDYVFYERKFKVVESKEN